MKKRYRIVKFVETRTRNEDVNPLWGDRTDVSATIAEVLEDGQLGWLIELSNGAINLLEGVTYDPKDGPVGVEFDIEVTPLVAATAESAA